jgi:hypothetical protein
MCTSLEVILLQNYKKFPTSLHFSPQIFPFSIKKLHFCAKHPFCATRKPFSDVLHSKRNDAKKRKSQQKPPVPFGMTDAAGDSPAGLPNFVKKVNFPQIPFSR